MLARLARWCFNNRWKVLGLWLVVIVAVFAWGGAVGSKYDASREFPASGSARGFKVLEQHFAGAGAGLNGTIVFTSTKSVDEPAVKAAMEQLFTKVDAIKGVKVASPYALPLGAAQVNKDRTVAYASVNLDKSIDQTEAGKIGDRIIAMLPKIDGTRIEIGGAPLARFVPPSSELIGLSFAIVVLILAFGSVLAMGLPIAVALGGVGTGVGLITLLSNVTKMPEFATTIGAMIGLGVGIDYALFIVTRYREGLRGGLTPERATMRAMDTAGRSVIFAGLTVVVSLLGMLLIGLSFVSGLGIGASITVACTMVASVTLLPALLGFAGARIEITRWRGLISAGLLAVAMLGAGLKVQPLLLGLPLAIIVFALGFAVAPLKAQVPERKRKPKEQTAAYRWSHAVQAHPWRSLIAGTAVMAVLAIPLFSLRLGFSDDGNYPTGSTTRKAYDTLSAGFGPGFNGPLLITVTSPKPGDFADVKTLAAAIGATPGVASVSPAIPDSFKDPASSKAFIIRVIPTTGPQDLATSDLVGKLRNTVIPKAVAGTNLDVNLTGNVAVGIDFTNYLSERMLLFFGVVLTVSFLLLMVVFRSLLVPLKAVIMNVISIAAAYGVVVAIFQWGWLGSVFNISGAPIEPFLPMMMFAIVFGLSMDYEVFLLSRVKEEFDRHGDARNSVADGLAATAQVITAAAAIMVVVFGSFVLEENRISRLFGLGLAVAVLLDATVVRMLLVPATMELLGAKNWWIPSWLDRILPRIDVEGATSEFAHELEAEDEIGDLVEGDLDDPRSGDLVGSGAPAE